MDVQRWRMVGGTLERVTQMVISPLTRKNSSQSRWTSSKTFGRLNSKKNYQYFPFTPDSAKSKVDKFSKIQTG